MSSELEKISTAALSYSEAMAPQVEEICSPLFNTFPLTRFVYAKVFHNGNYLILSDNASWLKQWFLKINSFTDTLPMGGMKKVQYGEPYFNLWSSAPPDKIDIINNQIDVYHGVDIHRRLEDSVELWSFGTTKENKGIENFCLNNAKFFTRFCLYFNDKADEFSTPPKLAVLKESLDISPSNELSFQKEFRDLIQIGNIRNFPFIVKNSKVSLTKRETECMYHMAMGKTVKEISREINISPRTVESYIIKVKNKTRCSNKSDLISMFIENTCKWI